ncbi:Nif3-like dinuclear metal center hexameric protein [Candidatus Sumerlaeota bacterium]|nr:Nif3-like dinuclear metal center hexameric protein [Candidatus Sumerlaeota bacterium]
MAQRKRHPSLGQLLAVIEGMAPPALAESYDNCGLQIGDRARPVHRVLVGLEVSDALIDEARRRRADAIVVHHPLFFLPIKRLDESDSAGHLARRLVRSDLALIAAHTNLDKSPGGTNTALAERLGLRDTEVLQPETVGREFKFTVFVPQGHEGAVIEAIACAGGGVIGDYDHCTFRTLGTGTFRGGAGTHPAIGEAGRLEEAQELRLEAVVPQRALTAVIESVRRVHPYEEMAFDVYPLESLPRGYGLGLLGTLPSPVALRTWARRVKKALGSHSTRMVGDPDRMIQRVAVASGACDMLIRDLSPPRVDCLVTGDVKYHLAVEARAKGLSVVDPGHWASEVIVTEPLAHEIASRLATRRLSAEVFASEAPESDPFEGV